MAQVTIVPIVEGQGEVQAVPILLRRLVRELCPELEMKVLHPIRRSRDSLLKREGLDLERDVILAGEKIEGAGAVLILIDSEGECPAQLGPEILQRAMKARSDREIQVVLAHQEFEAWFLAACVSLAGKRGLSEGLSPPPDPEAVQGAKEWLRARMQASRTYSEPIDQPALAAVMDLQAARSAPSFERMWRVCDELFQTLLRQPD